MADALRAGGHEVVGFVDRDARLLGKVVDSAGAQVLMTEEALLLGQTLPGVYGPATPSLALGIGNNSLRLELLGRLVGRDLPPVVHPRACVSSGATLGRGTVVLASAAVNTGAALGAAVVVNTGAVVEHDCLLEDGVHISPNATLAGTVTVRARAWIGAGSTVIEGLEIGPDSIVGAGAVVIRGVSPETTVVGVPARPLVGFERPTFP